MREMIYNPATYTTRDKPLQMHRRSHRPLAHPCADGTETGVHLAWGRAEDEGDDSVPRNLDILE